MAALLRHSPRRREHDRRPLLQEKRRTMNARRETTPQKRPSHGKKVLGGIEPTCRTPSDTTAPLAWEESAREKRSVGSGAYALRIGLTCSGVVVQLKRGSYATISDAVSYTHL